MQCSALMKMWNWYLCLCSCFGPRYHGSSTAGVWSAGAECNSCDAFAESTLVFFFFVPAQTSPVVQSVSLVRDREDPQGGHKVTCTFCTLNNRCLLLLQATICNGVHHTQDSPRAGLRFHHFRDLCRRQSFSRLSALHLGS